MKTARLSNRRRRRRAARTIGIPAANSWGGARLAARTEIPETFIRQKNDFTGGGEGELMHRTQRICTFIVSNTRVIIYVLFCIYIYLYVVHMFLSESIGAVFQTEHALTHPF